LTNKGSYRLQVQYSYKVEINLFNGLENDVKWLINGQIVLHGKIELHKLVMNFQSLIRINNMAIGNCHPIQRSLSIFQDKV